MNTSNKEQVEIPVDEEDKVDTSGTTSTSSGSGFGAQYTCTLPLSSAISSMNDSGTNASSSSTYITKTFETIDLGDFDVPFLERSLVEASEGRAQYGHQSKIASKGKPLEPKVENLLHYKSRSAPEEAESCAFVKRFEDEDQDEMEVRKMCGLRVQVKFRWLIVALVILLELFTIVVLIVPSTVSTQDTFTSLQTQCKDTRDTQEQLHTVVIQNMASTVGAIGGGNLFQEMITEVLDQPPHAANSLWNALQYMYNVGNMMGYGNIGHLGVFQGTLNETDPVLNLTDWQLSASPLISSIIRTGMYNQTAKAFVTFPSQYLDIQLYREPNTNVITQGVSSLVFRTVTSGDDPASLDSTLRGENEFYGFRYNLSLDTFVPNEDEYTPVSEGEWIQRSDYGPYFFQLRREQSNETSLLGSWSNMTLFFDAPQREYKWGFSFSWPWCPCGNYTCLKGVLGGVITSLDLSRYSNYLITTLTKSYVSVDMWVQQGVLAYKYDADLLQQLQVAEDATFSVNKLTSQEFSQLVNETMAFLIAADPFQEGVLVATSRDETDTIPVNGTIPRHTFAVNCTQPTIVGVSNYLYNRYGQFSVHNKNYTEKEYNEMVDFETFEACKFGSNDNEITMTASMSRCIYVTTSYITTTNITHFSSFNALGFISVTVVPYVFMIGNLTDELITTVQIFNAANRASSEQIWDSIMIEIILGVCFFVIALIGAIVISITVSRPLERLKRAMERLRNLDFSKPNTHSSRIEEISLVQESYRALNSTMKVVEKFIPRSVVRQILRNENNARELRVISQQVTIMFSDIKGFTSISEALEPGELLCFLTNYLTIMTRIIEAYEGTVGEIEGDGILGFWSTPDVVENHAGKACAAALAQQDALKTLRKTFNPLMKKYGLDPISIRIGINTGRVLTGNFGSASRRKFGCLGDSINLAARLEEICKLYGVGIVISNHTFVELPPDLFLCRKLDLVQAKGKTEGTVIYEVCAIEREFHDTRAAFLPKVASKDKSILTKREAGESKAKRTVYIRSVIQPTATVSQQRREDIERYEKALRFYQAGEFVKSKAELQLIYDFDRPCEFLLERINKQIETPTSSDGEKAWNGGLLSLSQKHF